MGKQKRMYSVLEDMLRHYVRPDRQDWDLFLSLAEFCKNNAYKTFIQCTPFQLLYGKNPGTPASAHLQNFKEQNPTATLRARDMHEHLERAKACMLAAQNRDKTYADKKTRPQTFEVGQRVLLSTKNMQIKRDNLSRKLLSRYIGPFKIVSIMGKQAYELELPPTMKMHDVFHVFSSITTCHAADRRQNGRQESVCLTAGAAQTGQWTRFCSSTTEVLNRAASFSLNHAHTLMNHNCMSCRETHCKPDASQQWMRHQ